MQLPIRHKMFRLSSVLDWTFGLILKIRLSACRHLKHLFKLGLRPELGGRTKSDLFYQVIRRLQLPRLLLLHTVQWFTIQFYYRNENCHERAASGNGSVWHLDRYISSTCLPVL